MKPIIKKLLDDKSKTVPILSFPSAKLLGISVRELLSSAEMQAAGMKAIAERCDVGAVLNMMDLSVEAEAFGAKVRFFEDDIPTVEEGILDDIADADTVTVPKVGAGRTGVCIEGIHKAKALITDRPVFCGVIGPYSLAGRLFDMTELMMECFDSPDEVGTLVGKAADFITDYILAYRAAGADGVILAEPAAGLLSPSLAAEFSMPYVKRIIDAVQSDDFAVCYHNCGASVSNMADAVSSLGADIYHFGNAVNMEKLLSLLPTDSLIMGNVDPVLLRGGTPDEVRAAVDGVYERYGACPNFMISTGCDVPAKTPWENLDAYFERVRTLYASAKA